MGHFSQFLLAFMTYGGSTEIKRKSCETFCYIQSSFYSAVNAFTALERKHDEIVGKIKRGMEDTKLHDHIVRIIVFLKRWLLQIEEGYCMGIKDKKHCGIKWFDHKASYCFGYMGNCLDHLQQFDRNSRKSCLAWIPTVH